MLKKMWVIAVLMLALIQIQASISFAEEEYEINQLQVWTPGSGSSTYQYATRSGQQNIIVRDNILFMVKLTDENHLYLYKSEDQGTTFSRVRIDDVPNRTWVGDASMAIGIDGTIYVTYYAYVSYKSYVYFSKSTDGGQTFTPSVLVSNDPGGWSPIVSVDSNNTVYIAWCSNGNQYWFWGITLAKSFDGGNTFNINTVVTSSNSDPDLAFHYKTSLNFAIGRHGEIYIAWLNWLIGDSANSKVIFLKSMDGGNTFIKTILDGNAWSSPINMAVDQKGNVYIAWTHVVSTSESWVSGIWLAKSEDNGDTFLAPVEVNKGVGPPVFGSFVVIAIDNSGHIFVSYRVGDDYFLSSSKDGGSSFNPVVDSPVAHGRPAVDLAIDSNGNLYIWSVDKLYIHLTKVSPKNTLQPAASLIAADSACDIGGNISLTWELSPDDPASGSGGSKVTGYNVYRSDTAGGPYSMNGTVVAGIGSFTDGSAVEGVSYYYIVRATDGTKESADSNEASAASKRNLPMSPTNLMAADIPYDLGGSITLSWTKSADDGGGLNNVAGYNIYRYSLSNGNIISIASLPAGSTGYVDRTTSDADTYYYFAGAYDGICNLESPASNIAEGRSINNFTALPDFIRTLPGISSQLLNSLTSKVENAIASYESGNTAAAINKLNALLNEISAQSGKGIETSTAVTLTAYVQGLIAYINAN